MNRDMDTEKHTNRQAKRDIWYSTRDSRSVRRIPLWVVLSQDWRSLHLFLFVIENVKILLL